jgi:hypothetical protein
MIPDLLGLGLPSLDGVALLAFGAKLAAMDIGVAVGTASAGVGEDEIGVALAAGHLGVHSAQRVACLIVIELGDVSNRLPARVGVTVLARDGDGAVGVTTVLFLRVGRRLRGGQKQKGPENELNYRRAHRTRPPGTCSVPAKGNTRTQNSLRARKSDNNWSLGQL